MQGAFSLLNLERNKYPYKKAGLATMEILNFISHSNYNITIYVKENTIVKMTKLRNFYLDFPSLTITTYSSSELTPTRSEIQVFYFKNEAFKIFSISQIYFIYFL